MGLLTFTSDYGTRDYYVAAVKGAVYSQLPDTTIVDISHEVNPFSISEAAYHLRNAYHYFPKGTVHLIGVRAEESEEHPHRLVSYDGHFFLGADTGIFRLIFSREPDAVYDLNLPSDSDVLTFPVLHVLVKAACHLLRGGTPEVLGRKGATLTGGKSGSVITDEDSIKGHVIHVDRYQNLITDITKSLFKEVGQGRQCTIHLRTRRSHIKRISNHYSDVAPGEMVALFNSSGFLEIAMNGGAPGNGGGAAQMQGLNLGDLILLVFDEAERMRRDSSEAMRSMTTREA